MASEARPLAAEDRALLDRLALRVVEMRLEVPAILALEGGRPLSLVAGQTMLFFEPLIQSLFRFDDTRRYAALVERREALDYLLTAIEARAEDQRAAKRKSRTEPAADSPGDRGHTSETPGPKT
jgi:hypothetical protein